VGDSRGLLLGFEGIAPVAAPQWPKWVNRYKLANESIYPYVPYTGCVVRGWCAIPIWGFG